MYVNGRYVDGRCSWSPRVQRAKAEHAAVLAGQMWDPIPDPAPIDLDACSGQPASDLGQPAAANLLRSGHANTSTTPPGRRRLCAHADQDCPATPHRPEVTR